MRNKTSSIFLIICVLLLIVIFPISVRSAEQPDTNLTADQALAGIGLTDEEKKWIKEKEKELMKKAAEMVTDGLGDGKFKDAAKYMIANVKDWSAFAGELSTGDYRNSVNLLATVGASELNEYIKNNLPDGKVKDAYEFFAANVYDVKDITIAMLDRSKSWSDVGDLIWKKTKDKAKKSLEDKAEEFVKGIINYTFGDKSLIGFTAGDVYLLMLKTEMQVIDVWNKKFDMNKQNELYAKWKAGEDIETLLLSGHYWKAFGRETSSETVLKMFKELYAKDPHTTEFAWWLRSKLAEEAQEIKEKEKTDAATVMENIRQRLQKDMNDYFAKIRKKQQELAEKELKEEIKKKRAAAIAEAKKLIELLKRTSGRIKEYCQLFEAAGVRVQRVFEELDRIRDAVRQLESLISIAKKASRYAEDARRLSDAITKSERLYKEFGDAYKIAEGAGKQSCRYSEQIRQLSSKDDAKNALNKSIEEARRASREIPKAENKAGELKRVEGDFATEMRNFTQKYRQEEINDIQNSVRKIETILNRLSSSQQMQLQSDFDKAMHEMREAVMKNESLLDYAKGIKERIKAIVAPYPQIDEIAKILTETETATDEASSCASTNKFNWTGGTDRWSKREPPRLPKVDERVLNDARAAITAAGALKDMPTLVDSVRKITETAKKVDTELYELSLLKRMYEKCVENAILAYNERWLAVKVVISGPSSANVGQEIAFEARVTSDVPAKYGFRWYANGKELGSIANTQKTKVTHIGNYTISVVVWRWENNNWQKAGEASHRLVAEVPPPPQPKLWVECNKPDKKAKPGEQVTCTAKIDLATRSSLDGMSAGAVGYYWYVNNKAMQPYGRDSITFTVPKDAQHGHEYKILARLARVRIDKNIEYLADAGATLKVVKQEASTEVTINASPGSNSLAGKFPTRGFGDSDKVDVWVPFVFQFSPYPNAIGAKVIMVVKPIEQLIGTDSLILKGVKKDHTVYSNFESLKPKSWNTVEVPISDNADLMDAIRRTGRIEGVIQDDTAVQSVKLVITIAQ